jgi:hypothetical protein
VVTELLPGIAPTRVVTPGAETARLGEGEDYLVRGPLAVQYWEAAAGAAQQAAASPSSLAPCAAADPAGQRACAQRFVAAFARRAFRRPVEPGEIAELLAVYDAGAQASYARGLETVVTAVLQSADFLYRTELGDPRATGSTVRLTPHEVASALSFLFLGSAPDAALSAAADSGALANAAVVDEQVARLLATADVRKQMTGFLTNVLGAGQALSAQRDPKEFPELDTALRQAMADEGQALVSANTWGRQPLAQLFTTRQAVLTPKLAALYGVAGPVAAGATVELPPGKRGGILTRAATLVGMPTGSRAVHRGLFLADNYLCRVVPSPPEQVQTEIGQTLALGLDERAMAELRAGRPQCAVCHAHFDALGLAFEHYDLVGRWLSDRDGAPVDASGVLSGTDVDGPFRDVVELGERLARSRNVAACIADNAAALALGRNLTEGERCTVERTLGAWAAGDRQLGALLPLLASSRFLVERERGR